MTGKRVVLTADRSLMTNYRGNFLYGFIACGPYEVLPEWVFDKVFCPSVETDPITGEVKVAQVGLRRIESSLIQGGYKREDIWIQTKFTSLDGQDPKRIPYDKFKAAPEQARESIEVSRRNLK